jgi:uncharacterized protein with GYD domain
MPRYLVTASYSPEGVKGVLAKGGTARAAAVGHAIEALGGKMESFDFAFGTDDAVVIVELPDNVAAAAVGLAIAATGSLSASKTTVLITPDEIDRAAKQTVAYTPPGG